MPRQPNLLQHPTRGGIFIRGVRQHDRKNFRAARAGPAQRFTPRAHRQGRLGRQPGVAFGQRNLEPVRLEKARPLKILQRDLPLLVRDFSERTQEIKLPIQRRPGARARGKRDRRAEIAFAIGGGRELLGVCHPNGARQQRFSSGSDGAGQAKHAQQSAHKRDRQNGSHASLLRILRFGR